MTPSAACTKLIQDCEGFKPTAYRLPRDRWTIGWGHTAGVKEHDTCTTTQALEWLYADMTPAAHAVNTVVTVTLKQHEFDALVSLAFNIGAAAFEGSTLVQLLNTHQPRALVAGQFARWNKQKGRVLDGLTARRAKEKELFLAS